MRNIRFAGILVLIAVLMSMAFSANAGGAGPTIRANETFDGDVVFLDQKLGHHRWLAWQRRAGQPPSDEKRRPHTRSLPGRDGPGPS